MLIENNEEDFEVVSIGKKKSNLDKKKRASSTKKRHIPLMAKMDYSLSNSSEDDKKNKRIEEEDKFNDGMFIDDYDQNG